MTFTLGAALGLAALGLLLFPRFQGADVLSARVERGKLVIRLVEAGVLRPAQATSYRSPLAGREAEVLFLAPEGVQVIEGDLIARLDTTDLERELERSVQEVRQAQAELRMAEVEQQEARATLDSLTEGQGALALEEARASLELTEKRVERLRAEYESLKPLLDRGFITQDELDRTLFELEQAVSEAELARRKTEVYAERTYPQEVRRAQHQLSSRGASLENARAKLEEAASRVRWLQQSIQSCSIYAKNPGLVIYEEYLAGSPRRKIRVGDRVTSSQVLVTIPEVNRMLVETSVREADVHRVRPDQLATIRLDAYPGVTLQGKVIRVGTLARSEVDPRFEDKRFDLTVEVTGVAAVDLRPEMTARVDIGVGEKEGVLLVPVNAVFESDGSEVAYVLRPWGVEKRLLDLGEANDIQVEVLDGLREGERVALVDFALEASPGPGPARPSGEELKTRIRPMPEAGERLAPR
jgi:multidrug efflux pump subunit AcrA (membrane-fusion protein)